MALFAGPCSDQSCLVELSLPRTFSQAFLSQLKVVLFGRVGVGSASE